jgi:tetratricopeptide (TPR) repeat protein
MSGRLIVALLVLLGAFADGAEGRRAQGRGGAPARAQRQRTWSEATPRSRPSRAEGEAKQENLLKVASLLVKDGHLDRASATLSEIKPRTKDQRGQFYSLSGLVALKRGDHKLAERNLVAAIKTGLKDKTKERSAFLFLAQARFGQQSFQGTLEALDRTGDLGLKFPGIYLMRAQCHWRARNKVGAWEALQQGIRHHPTNKELQRQKVLLMVDLGLYQQATTAGLRYLGRSSDEPNDYAAIAEALRRGRQHRKAILILEQAKLRFPRNDTILKQLARSYLDDGKPFAAAELLARAAYRTPRYRLEAAELYRRAGRLMSAIFLNEQATQQKAKVRQRLGLLVELERFEEAASLAPRMSRLGLLKDESIVYALAYSLYKTGRFEASERYLKRITKPELFKRSIQLRKAMDSCRKLGWECSL